MAQNGPGPTPASIVIEALLRTCSPRLRAHHARVGAMSESLALYLGLDEAEARRIGHAGSLHDIGMAFLPQDMLDQHGLLSVKEKAEIRRHSMFGHDLLEMAGDPAYALAAKVALQHHERWDGSGYPNGLAGEEICLAARIVAVCGVYDALRHPRPGRESRGHDAALAILGHGDKQSRAIAFDPALVAAFAQSAFERHRLAMDRDRLQAAA